MDFDESWGGSGVLSWLITLAKYELKWMDPKGTSFTMWVGGCNTLENCGGSCVVWLMIKICGWALCGWMMICVQLFSFKGWGLNALASQIQ